MTTVVVPVDLAEPVEPRDRPGWADQLIDHLGVFARRESTFAPNGDNKPTVGWTEEGLCLVYVVIGDPMDIVEALGLGTLPLTVDEAAKRVVVAALLDHGYTSKNSTILDDHIALVTEPE